jgi:DNA mismatch endonuclease, patch repair protein
MGRVRHKDTKPEMLVRRALHRAGHRFRLQARDLPGRPDIVFSGDRVAIFVHGCFWHRHPGCEHTRTPKTRVEFWNAKFNGNVRRDEASQAALEAADWNVLVIWECEARDPERLTHFVEAVHRARRSAIWLAGNRNQNVAAGRRRGD